MRALCSALSCPLTASCAPPRLCRPPLPPRLCRPASAAAPPQVVAGYPNPASLGIDAGCAAFHYLNQSGVTSITGVDDKASYDELRTAMGHIGLSEEDREHVCKLLASLLHIGNIRFTGEDEAAIDAATAASSKQTVSLLGTANLETCLISSTLTTRGETVQVRVTAGLGVATKTRKQSTVVACATFGLSTRSGLESESSTAPYRICERCLQRRYHCRVPLLTGQVQRSRAFLQHTQRSI